MIQLNYRKTETVPIIYNSFMMSKLYKIGKVYDSFLA